jgi:hypothetical protein
MAEVFVLIAHILSALIILNSIIKIWLVYVCFIFTVDNLIINFILNFYDIFFE